MNMHETIKGEASSQDEISIFRSMIGLLLCLLNRQRIMISARHESSYDFFSPGRPRALENFHFGVGEIFQKLLTAVVLAGAAERAHGTPNVNRSSV